MSLLSIHALPVVNAELLCKRRIYSLPIESNGGVDGRWLPTHITHSTSSSHLQLESLSRCVMVLERMQCNWALIMRRPTSQLYVGIATFDAAALRTRSASYKCCNALVKWTVQSRAVRIWTIKIGFDPAANSIRIRSIKIGFDPDSVLETVRTLRVAVKWCMCRSHNMTLVHSKLQLFRKNTGNIY